MIVPDCVSVLSFLHLQIITTANYYNCTHCIVTFFLLHFHLDMYVCQGIPLLVLLMLRIWHSSIRYNFNVFSFDAGLYYNCCTGDDTQYLIYCHSPLSVLVNLLVFEIPDFMLVVNLLKYLTKGYFMDMEDVVLC